MVHITSMVMEKMQHHKSMGVFCCHGNQTKRQTGRLLAIFNCPYPFNICTKLESYCFSGFGEVVIKKSFFLKLTLPWKPTEMVSGHEHTNWVDNHQMIITAKYGSHYFTDYENVI